jgi:TolB-like protein
VIHFKPFVCVLCFWILSFPVPGIVLDSLNLPAARALAATDSESTRVRLPATIAVLPFTIHAAESEEFSYIQHGVVNMFHTRLAWPDKVHVIHRRQIQKILEPQNQTDRNQVLTRVADQTGSDLVLDGSITKLAGSFSIDALVYDIRNKRYMAFFEQSKDSDELIEKVGRIAAGINKQVFDRSTTAWEQMEQERQAKINELRRRNPEHLMQNPQWQPQNDSPGWKIWKYLF